MRFTGTIEPFADVAVSVYVKRLNAIPVHDWTKMADASWQGWGDWFTPLSSLLVANHYPGCFVSGLGMFVLEPGQVHPAHKDIQPSYWLTRIHVPIITNPKATIIMDDGVHHLKVGKAYRFNTLAMHEVRNDGATHRAHFIFDVRT
jgi:hypothetical protein